MIDADDSHVILNGVENHPENPYLKIAILLVASAAASQNDLKIQPLSICRCHILCPLHAIPRGDFDNTCAVIKHLKNKPNISFDAIMGGCVIRLRQRQKNG